MGSKLPGEKAVIRQDYWKILKKVNWVKPIILPCHFFPLGLPGRIFSSSGNRLSPHETAILPLIYSLAYGSSASKISWDLTTLPSAGVSGNKGDWEKKN
jgi:hypothetical protein